MESNYKKQRIPCPDSYKILYDTIKSNIPVLVGKIGSVELRTIIESIFIVKGSIFDFSFNIQKEMIDCAGIYPVLKPHIINFISLFLESIKQINVMASWNDSLLQYEAYLWQNYALLPNEKNEKNNTIKLLVELSTLEPFYTTPENWWHHLYQNKTILVITPFVKSIQNQLANRSKVWQKQWTNFWPENIIFKFIKTQHPYTTLSTTEQAAMPANSLELFKQLIHQIDTIADFDIAFIGAGAYSIPLAAYIKTQKNRTAIHLGGGLQMMFGVAGSRWKNSNNPFFKEYINEHWISPLPEETPLNYKLQENGCYF